MHLLTILLILIVVILLAALIDAALRADSLRQPLTPALGGRELQPERSIAAVLAPITKDNITELRQLAVREDQAHFVANIDDSLIQASFLPNWQGFALVHDGRIVGFGSFAAYSRVPGAVKIYKMMIAADEQGKGYGTQLLTLLLDRIGHTNVYIDLHSDNSVAKALHSKRFDEVSDDGTTLVMKLRP